MTHTAWNKMPAIPDLVDNRMASGVIATNTKHPIESRNILPLRK
jgi:hypothetical protein